MRRLFLFAALFLAAVSASPLERPPPELSDVDRRLHDVNQRFRAPSNRGPINDLPVIEIYHPEKAPEVPIKLGERRKKILLYRISLE